MNKIIPNKIKYKLNKKRYLKWALKYKGRCQDTKGYCKDCPLVENNDDAYGTYGTCIYLAPDRDIKRFDAFKKLALMELSEEEIFEVLL